MQKEIHTKANRVYFSHLLPKECPILWSELKSHLDSREIEYAFLNYSKNIRCRDCMPIQTADDTMVHYWYYPDYLEKKCSQRTQSQVVYSNMYKAFPNVNHKPLNWVRRLERTNNC